MKKRLIQLTTLSLLMSLVFSLVVSASAAAPKSELEIQASSYFHTENLGLAVVGSGKITVEIDVVSTAKMQELGATDLYIYEVQSDGRYTQVAHYTRDRYPVLIKKDVSQAIIQLTYQGKAGKRYYAEARCYAKNASGSGTRWASSSIITAT